MCVPTLPKIFRPVIRNTFIFLFGLRMQYCKLLYNFNFLLLLSWGKSENESRFYSWMLLFQILFFTFPISITQFHVFKFCVIFNTFLTCPRWDSYPDCKLETVSSEIWRHQLRHLSMLDVWFMLPDLKRNKGFYGSQAKKCIRIEMFVLKIIIWGGILSNKVLQHHWCVIIKLNLW